MRWRVRWGYERCWARPCVVLYALCQSDMALPLDQACLRGQTDSCAGVEEACSCPVSEQGSLPELTGSTALK
jgi:hypothetical protein